MTFENYRQKETVALVYTGEGKGKTSASLGLMARALGHGWSVAFLQFIKHWQVGEHDFIQKIQPLFGAQLHFYKGGRGFYNAGEISAANIPEQEHRDAAERTYLEAMACARSGNFQLVICDEMSNAVHDGLLKEEALEAVLRERHERTSICITGRYFPERLLPLVDIATHMSKIKHHFDDRFLANPGIDY